MAISPISHPQMESGQPAQKALKTSAETPKAEVNAAIVQTVSIDAKEQPMELLFKAAIEKLNEMLAPELGAEAIQAAAASGMDFSPEATADRIVGFATSFYGVYQENHQDDEGGPSLDGFMSIIRDAIDKGFQEARDILEGLQVLEGDIAADIDQTYELVQQGLARFEEAQAEQMVTA
jgi:hypothetical protein